MATHVEKSEAMFALRPDQICSRILRLRARKSQRATEALERVVEVRCAMITGVCLHRSKSTAVAISHAKQPRAQPCQITRALSGARAVSHGCCLTRRY